MKEKVIAMKLLAPMVLVCLSLILVLPLSAQESGMVDTEDVELVGTEDSETKEGAEAQEAKEGPKQGSLGFEFWFGRFEDDLYLKASIFFSLYFEEVGVLMGLQGPFNIRLMDLDPKDGENGVKFRQKDWDEPSDFGKVIRFFDFHRKVEDISINARYGVLDGITFGHRTIMSNYDNVMDMDHYQGGLTFDFASNFFGISLMLDNFLKPEIAGGRLHINPGYIAESEKKVAQSFQLGFTYVSDFRAPLSLKTNTDGSFDLDSLDFFQAEEMSVANVFGMDWEVTLADTEKFFFKPYMDFNTLLKVDYGNGLHTGAEIKILMSSEMGIWLLLTAEYRLINRGYLPSYFDPFYEIQRYQYFTADSVINDEKPLPKLGWLNDSSNITRDSWSHGAYGQFGLDFSNKFRIIAEIDDIKGRNNSNLTIKLVTPDPDSPFRMLAYYSKRNMEKADDFFFRDDDGELSFENAAIWKNALMGFQLRINLGKAFYLHGHYDRIWQATENGYEEIDNFGGGFGLNFEF